MLPRQRTAEPEVKGPTGAPPQPGPGRKHECVPAWTLAPLLLPVAREPHDGCLSPLCFPNLCLRLEEPDDLSLDCFYISTIVSGISGQVGHCN